jgi:hypothetical protein
MGNNLKKTQLFQFGSTMAIATILLIIGRAAPTMAQQKESINYGVSAIVDADGTSYGGSIVVPSFGTVYYYPANGNAGERTLFPGVPFIPVIKLGDNLSVSGSIGVQQTGSQNSANGWLYGGLGLSGKFDSFTIDARVNYAPFNTSPKGNMFAQAAILFGL